MARMLFWSSLIPWRLFLICWKRRAEGSQELEEFLMPPSIAGQGRTPVAIYPTLKEVLQGPPIPKRQNPAGLFQNNLGALLLVAQIPHLLPLCSILAEDYFFTGSEERV